MAQPLPDFQSLPQRPAPDATPNVQAPQIDTRPIYWGAQSLGQGIGQLGGGVQARLQAQDQADKYDAEKKLVDFQMQSELALEAHKRDNMQPGGVGFTDSWNNQYKQMADNFFGEDGANIPASQRRAVDLGLVQQQKRLNHRAVHYQYAEQDRQNYTDLQTTLDGLKSFAEANPDRRDEMHAKGMALISQAPVSPVARARMSMDYPRMLDDAVERAKFANGDIDSQIAQIERLQKGPTAGSQPGITSASNGRSTVTSSSGANLVVATPYADRFAGLVKDLEAAGIAIDPKQTGGYNNRTIAGTNTPSKHAFGEAVDINWDDNQQGANSYSKLVELLGADKVREIAQKNGLKWGGDWQGKKYDPMHFEVDRSVNYTPPPISQRGITTVAGMNEDDGDGQSSSPASGLNMADRHRLLNVFRGQLHAVVGNQVQSAIDEVRRTGQMSVDDKGRTALDYAKTVMQPNQYQKFKLAADTAADTYRVVSPLANMSLAEAAQHLDNYNPANAADDEDPHIRQIAWNAGRKAWAKIQSERTKDSFAASLQTPEMQKAIGEVQGVTPSDSHPGVKPVMSETAANVHLVEASLAAQTRLGIPAWKQRVVSREQAEMLLGGALGNDVAPADRVDRLKTVAQQAVLNYGPIYGPRAFYEAVGHKMAGDKNKQMLGSILEDVLGEDTASLMKEIPHQEPQSSGWFGGVFSKKDTNPAPQQWPTPKPEAVDWLKRDPHNRWRQFADKFGEQAAYDVFAGKKK